MSGDARRIAPFVPLALGLLAATAPLSIDAYLPAFPRIGEEFAAPAASIQLSLTACLLGLGVGQLLAGPIGDRFGRRTPLLIGAGAYTVASLGCAAAASAEMLIGLRLAQGLTGAVLVVLSRAIVHDIAAGHDALRMYSRMAAITSAAPVVAPLGGGVIIEFFGWRAVFVTLAGLGGLMVVAILAIGETHPRAARLPSLRGAMLPAYRGALSDRRFRWLTVTVMFSAATLFGYISGSPFVLQGTFGMTELQYSLTFAVTGSGLVLAGLINARLTARFSAMRVLRTSSLLQISAAALLTVTMVVEVVSEWSSLPLLIVLLFLAVVPCGIITPTCIALGMARSRNTAGASSAVLGVSMFLAGAVVSPLSG